LRVLAVTNMYPTADRPGFGVFVARQMESVARAGVEVHIEFIDARGRLRRYGSALRRVRQLARSGRFDLVHAHYGVTGFIAVFQPLPLVISYCGDDLLGTPNGRGGLTPKSRIQRWLSLLAARRADAIICKSEQLRLALDRAGDRARTAVLPNGVDTNRFCPGDRREARKRLGLALDQRLVLFPHTAVPRKRHDLAEAAISALGAPDQAPALWVVGGVPHDAMPDHYRAADCLLVTSDQEGSPNVVKEALCCDLPVVSVATGDVRRWLSLALGCQLVERDPNSIAAGLRAVLAGSGRVDGERVRAEVSAERIASQILAVYRKTLGRPGR
jgi:glycosyltransferase involved in cell wall biosynthesis